MEPTLPTSDTATRPRFSVIVPTYQRRDLVIRCLQALARQRFARPYEIVVVVDGSTDGTTERLQGLEVDVPLTVILQENRGAASARNRGAESSRGELLLFLDDDMEADQNLLLEHDRTHRAGADVVLGHLPLHPDSPRTVISQSVGYWAAGRLERLSAAGSELTLHDLLTGQLSISAEVFNAIGGFDCDFTRGGTFGNEDVDFGYRLLRGGWVIEFNPRAVSWQNYIVGPRAYLRQWKDAGKADVLFASKHPDEATTLFELNGMHDPGNRLFWRPLLALPLVGGAVASALRAAAVASIERGGMGKPTKRLFRMARNAHYLRGVSEAGGIPGAATVRVLVYHAVRDLSGYPVLKSYGTPPEQFRAQIAGLQRAGFTFVSANDFVDFLDGRGALPRRSVLLTFDDAYEDVLSSAFPILQELQVPSVVFAVSTMIGETNVWDQERGMPPLPLLDLAGLRQLSAGGVEIGSHSRTHASLPDQSPVDVEDEVVGSMEAIEARGLPRPRLFSYPYGACDPQVESVVAAAGYAAAFTVQKGVATRGGPRWRVPRIEILREDGAGRRFLWKVVFPGGDDGSMMGMLPRLGLMLTALRSRRCR